MSYRKMLGIFTLTMKINKLKKIHSNSNINVRTFQHDIVEQKSGRSVI